MQESAPVPLLAAPTVSFDGINNRDGVLPPDVNGDAGPNHYVQWVNLSYAVYNKSGTLPGRAAQRAARCSAGLRRPVRDAERRRSDRALRRARRPVDAVAVRAAELSRPARSTSASPCRKTGDPTGQYWRYEFKISDTKLNDYPKFGVWPNGYFMSVNQFAGNTFAGAGVVAFERDKMLQGLAAAHVLRRHE